MATLGTAANLFGVITPAKDVAEVIIAIMDLVEKVKQNKIKISTLIKTLIKQIEWVDSAISLYEHATQEQLKSLMDLKLSLKYILTELQELDQNRRQRSSYLIGTSKELWNSGEISTRIEQLEFDIKQCHDLFVVDSLTCIKHTDNIHTSMLMRIEHNTAMLLSTQPQLISNNNSNITQLGQGGRLSKNWQRTRVECTTMLWKTPVKADLSDPKAVNYAYLSNKVSVLLEYLKSDDGWIEYLLQNDMQDFTNTPSGLGLLPMGDPIRECEDASGKAIQLSRVMQEQNSHISAVEWCDDLHRLGISVHDVGLRKEALQISQFQYYIWTFLASDRGNNVNSYLACSLHNIASSYFEERRYDEALPFMDKAVEIYRRLGAPFIPNLADSVRFLSNCFRHLGQFEKATESLQESIDLIQELALNDPLRYGHEMAKCLTDKALLHYDLQEYQKAVDCSEEAIQWLSKSSLRFKDDFAFDYGCAQWNKAIAFKKLGDFQKAEEYGRDATKMFNRLIHDRPLYYLTDSTATDFSDWFCEMGRSQDAIYILEESLAIYCSVVPSPAVQKKFADALNRRAEILHSSDSFVDALDALSQVIDTRCHLLEEDETDAQCLLNLLSAFRLRCSCLISLRRQPEAVKSIETALDTLRSSLSKVEFDETQIKSILQELIFHESMLETVDNMEAVKNLKKYRRALLCIEEAILLFRQFILDGKRSHSNLARLLELRYLIFSQMNKFDNALLSIREVVSLHYDIVHRNGDTKSLINLIKALNTQARCLRSMQRIEDALALLDKVFEQIWAQEQSLLLIEGIINTYISVFDILNDQKEYLKALDSVNKSIQAVRLLNAVGDANRVQMLLGRMLVARSSCYFGLGHFEDAIGNANKANEILRSLMAEGTDKQYLARSLYEHAKSSFALRDITGALKSIKEAVDIVSRFNGNPIILSLELYAEILCSLESATDSHVNLSGVPESQLLCLNGMQLIDYALASFDRVFEHIRSIWAQRQSVTLIEGILNFYDTFVDSLIEKKEYSRALDSMNKSVEVIGSFSIGNSNRVRMLLGPMLDRRSSCYFELGRYEEAVGDAEKAIQIFKFLMADNTDKYECDLASCLYEHARSSFALSRIDSAVRSIKEAIDIESRIQLRNPDEILDDFCRDSQASSFNIIQTGNFRWQRRTEWHNDLTSSGQF